MNVESGSVVPRSSFVTGLAWTFIVLAGLGTLVSVLENVVFNLMLSNKEILDAMRQARGAPGMPPFAYAMLDHIHLLVAGFLVVSTAMLVSAIGLLKRMNWARIVFVGWMMLGAAWNLAGLFIPYFMASSLTSMPHAGPPELQQNLQLMAKIMIGVTTVVAIVFAGLFAWFAKRLMSEEIKREFYAR